MGSGSGCAIRVFGVPSSGFRGSRARAGSGVHAFQSSRSWVPRAKLRCRRCEIGPAPGSYGVNRSIRPTPQTARGAAAVSGTSHLNWACRSHGRGVRWSAALHRRNPAVRASSARMQIDGATRGSATSDRRRVSASRHASGRRRRREASCPDNCPVRVRRPWFSLYRTILRGFLAGPPEGENTT